MMRERAIASQPRGLCPPVIYSTLSHTRIGPDRNRLAKLQPAESAGLVVIPSLRKIVGWPKTLDLYRK